MKLFGQDILKAKCPICGKKFTFLGWMMIKNETKVEKDEYCPECLLEIAKGAITV